MLHRPLKHLVPILVVGCLAAGPPMAVRAAAGPREAPPRTVSDEGGFFSKRARETANAEIADIKKRFEKDLMIETFGSAPDDIKEVDLKDTKAKRKYFVDWARRRATNLRIDGVYVLICKKPSYVIQVAGRATRQKAFTDANLIELGKRLFKNLKDKKNDDALTEGVTYVRDTMEKNLATAARKNVELKQQPIAQVERNRTTTTKKEEGMPIWGWICIGLVVLVVVWLVIGVIRALTAPRVGYGGGPGYGGGGGGYGGGGYGGGGGGGFFSSLMGGLFGAAAGMYLYNNFFGGHTSSSGFGGSTGADAGVAGGATPESGPSDVGGDYTAGGGGDFGGDDAGGDDAGGGGDFGGDDAGGGGDFGGDDAGGGGDFGGGGGDFGGGDFGGGGGDFGGGGGDFGGGGGDFGGGGGGGDF